MQILIIGVDCRRYSGQFARYMREMSLCVPVSMAHVIVLAVLSGDSILPSILSTRILFQCVNGWHEAAACIAHCHVRRTEEWQHVVEQYDASSDRRVNHPRIAAL